MTDTRVTCVRCGEDRWPCRAPCGPYSCQRCREALVGGNATDPLPSEAQRVARSAARERIRQSAPGPILLGNWLQAERSPSSEGCNMRPLGNRLAPHPRVSLLHALGGALR
jgi:hypothetical protein